MLNCLDPDDYYRCTDRLRSDLQRRGYAGLQTMPYDNDWRQQRITALAQRSRQPRSSNRKEGSGVFVFKTDYHPLVSRLRVRDRCNMLISRLRKYLGTSFLSDARLVVAHPKRTSTFLQMYRYNFDPVSDRTSGFNKGWEGPC